MLMLLLLMVMTRMMLRIMRIMRMITTMMMMTDEVTILANSNNSNRPKTFDKETTASFSASLVTHVAVSTYFE